MNNQFSNTNLTFDWKAILLQILNKEYFDSGHLTLSVKVRLCTTILSCDLLLFCESIRHSALYPVLPNEKNQAYADLHQQYYLMSSRIKKKCTIPNYILHSGEKLDVNIQFVVHNKTEDTQ